MWLAEHEPHTWALVESGRYAVGTVDSYLIARMTRGTWHVTDVSNACRTLLLRPVDRRLVRRAVRAVRRTPRRAARAGAQLGRDRAPPTPRRSAACRCRSRGSPATSSRRCSGRPASTPATPSAPTAPARSSSPTPARTLERSDAGLLSTAAWRSPDGELTYALEGAIFVTGAAVQWLRDGLQIVGSAAETAAIAATVDDTEGVVFVPALTGLGAPHWDPHARGTDHRHHPRHHPRPHRPRHAGGDRLRGARRAGDDAAATDRHRCASTAAPPPTTCSASSRPTSSASGRRAAAGSWRRPALGAAFLAGLGAGVWASTDDLRETWQLDRRLRPVATTAPAPTPPTPVGWTPSERSKGWAE